MEADEKEANVRLAQCKLAAAHQELEDLVPRLIVLSAAHERWQGDRAAIQSRIDALSRKLDNLRPPNLERLAAFDVRRKRWAEESAPLFAKQKKLIAERDSCQTVDPMEIMRIASRIAHLKDYVIVNLENVIVGRQEFRGGVFHVA